MLLAKTTEVDSSYIRISLRVYKIGRLAKYKKVDLDVFIVSRLQAL
jgi:hypothetical protein